MRDLLPKYDLDYVINTDQSGIQLEFYSTRTLSYKGEKATALTVRSKNATTHSFTVQPCVSLTGKLVGPLFLCLKEPTGYLSENIRVSFSYMKISFFHISVIQKTHLGYYCIFQGRLFKAPNIVVSCSKSGKLTTDLVKFWRDNVLLPFVSSHRTLLISDSWPGQSNITGIYNNINKLYRLEIPKHTTAQIQPLDLFYNNQHKYIARRMFDRVLLDGLDINLSERNCIIRSQSLIYNQLCAPVFRKMLQYAWHASGYIDDHPGSFLTVKQVCFTFDNVPNNGGCCESSPFICCSWCRNNFCFQHFFSDYHFHHSLYNLA